MNVDNINVRQMATIEELNPFNMDVPVVVVGGDSGFFSEWKPINIMEG
ncbi:MAG: hypothetical protein IJ640_10360 [Prevotella sp.]|nr:hypothetical protein [Prevotella sp.]